MNPQPTLQTLPIDCLIEIASYLSLPECMFLRSSSRQLKAAVDEHFRTGVRTLPVVLSARYSPESVALYDEYCQQNFRINDYDHVHYNYYNHEQYERFAYGSTSGVSQLEMYDDKAEYKLEDYDAHFRSENFLVLFDMAKLNQFVDFITKYLPGITKLALIIDHEDHMNHVPTILNLFRKQLKLLFVERTARSAKKLEYNYKYDIYRKCVIPLKITQSNSNSKEINFSPEFYHSIDGLEALEELHFFPKEINNFRYNADGRLKKRHFLKRMLQKLKVLHFRDCYDRTSRNENFDTWYYRSAVFESLEKLICNEKTIEIWLNASFPRLETLIVDFHSFAMMEPQNMPSLRTVHVRFNCSFDDDDMGIINKFPKLERLHCQELYLLDDLTMVNRSIKFIEIEELEDEYYEDDEDEDAFSKLKKCLRCFYGLEKVILREPFMELTGSDLLRIHE